MTMNEWCRWWWRIEPGDRQEMKNETRVFMEWIRGMCGPVGFAGLQFHAGMELQAAKEAREKRERNLAIIRDFIPGFGKDL